MQFSTLEAEVIGLRAENARLRWNDGLGMLNAAGLSEAIRTLPGGLYTVVFADVDKLKCVNTATGSHAVTNSYLARGFAVRDSEIAGQLYGDELVFIIRGPAAGFVQRIARQLRAVPLTTRERRALMTAGVNPWLSATFASEEGVAANDIETTVARLSANVLSQKAARDAGRA